MVQSLFGSELENAVKIATQEFLQKRLSKEQELCEAVESAHNYLLQEYGKDELGVTQEELLQRVIRCISDRYIDECVYELGLTAAKYDKSTLENPEWMQRRIEEVIQAVKAEREEER